MAMSDCIKCWDTPCRCGHDYSHWSEKDLEDQIKMLQRVLSEKRMTAFRNENDIDVVLQPNVQILQRYHDMIVARETEKLIQLDVAKIHDSGIVNAVSHNDGLTKIVLVDSGHGYVMADAVFVKLDLMMGERVIIIQHHQQYRILKSPPRVASAKTESN